MYVAVICIFQMTPTVFGFMMNAESESLSQSVECMSCSSQCDEAAVLTDRDTVDVSNTPCAVCLDRGSGFHYGVYTCEGCKVGLTSSDIDWLLIGVRMHSQFCSVTVSWLQ